MLVCDTFKRWFGIVCFNFFLCSIDNAREIGWFIWKFLNKAILKKTLIFSFLLVLKLCITEFRRQLCRSHRAHANSSPLDRWRSMFVLDQTECRRMGWVSIKKIESFSKVEFASTTCFNKFLFYLFDYYLIITSIINFAILLIFIADHSNKNSFREFAKLIPRSALPSCSL